MSLRVIGYLSKGPFWLKAWQIARISLALIKNLIWVDFEIFKAAALVRRFQFALKFLIEIVLFHLGVSSSTEVCVSYQKLLLVLDALFDTKNLSSTEALRRCLLDFDLNFDWLWLLKQFKNTSVSRESKDFVFMGLYVSNELLRCSLVMGLFWMWVWMFEFLLFLVCSVSHYFNPKLHFDTAILSPASLMHLIVTQKVDYQLFFVICCDSDNIKNMCLLMKFGLWVKVFFDETRRCR